MRPYEQRPEQRAVLAMLRSDAQVKRMTDLQMREKAKAEELKKAQELEALIAKAEAGGKLSNKEQRAYDKSTGAVHACS